MFLGAGASVPFGFPMTDQILPLIWAALASGDWKGWAGIPRDAGLAHTEAEDLRTFLQWMLPGLADNPTAIRGASIIDAVPFSTNS